MNSSNKAAALLKKQIEGEVREDMMSRHIYSVDASIFEITPAFVTLPKNKEDLLKIVAVASDFNLPIIPRGGATGIAGGCIGTGIIVDTSKYLNRIIKCDPQEGYAICEPGVIQDQLNETAGAFGLRLGADTSTGNRATIGGMCATNAAGSHYLKYGNMIDHVLEVEMVLSNGELIQLNETSDLPSLPTPRSPPTFHRSSSGYPLYTLLEKPRNLAKLTVGSEGSLGLFTEIKVKLSPIISQSSLAILPFRSLPKSLENIEAIMQYQPIALELLDHHIIQMGRLSPLLKGKLNWLNPDVKALLIVEFETAHPPNIHSSQINLIAQEEQAEVWTLRKAGLGLLLSRRSYTRAIAFIEDLALPREKLPDFIPQLQAQVPWEMGIYGHAGDGCLHIRPYVCLTNPQEIDQIFHLMPQIAQLVKSYGGVLSGEHGDGILRTWLNPSFFGKQGYEEMVQIKELFDPLNLMNPGKVVKGEIPKKALRQTRPIQIPTFLNFEKEGGLHLAADLCNGNGACRKTKGLMCPSFHAYHDEKHTTRARAQSLRSILNGLLPIEELTEKGLLDVLDYCLECKGCKKECPSQVDMAKMKMEMLYRFQEKQGYFLKNRLFGHYPLFAKFASHLPHLSNVFLTNFFTKKLLSLTGISSKRELPSMAQESFSKWWSKRRPIKREQKVHLFIDTFTEYNSPEVGKAAVALLEKCGFEVLPLMGFCCGRTYLSVGMLKEAKSRATHLFNHFKGRKEPIIVLEPSCLSAIADDYPSLIGNTIKVHSIEEILPTFKVETPVFYHPHCHEQALFDPTSFKRFFPNMILSGAGCCGLAGSFGYEKRHFEMSLKIAENQLFPQVRALKGLPILASGFSCRQQISFGIGQETYHPVQLLLKHHQDY